MSTKYILSSKRELEVIEYPGKVENVDNMIATLGGITRISQAFGGELKKLELRYHFENPYNKGTFSESVPGFGILLAIKVRRYKKKSRPPEYEVRLLGHFTQTFTFKNLCDFQYLPMCKVPGTKPFYPFNQLMPSSPTDAKYFSQADAPFFCLPTSFARSDTIAPSTNIFRYDANEDCQTEHLVTAPKIALEAREFITFNMNDPFPAQPDSQIAKRMKVKYVSDEQFQRVKKLFEECPIWTRIALLYESGVSIDKMKCIIPALAYYFSTGPWRMLYVRFGYDPRKHFESRHYQTFDFRMRYRSGISEFIAVRKHILQKQQHESPEEGALTQDIHYPYFDEHKLPRSRQCIMRYCDLHVSKVHEMLEKIPSPLAGAICNEKTGWLPAGFDAQVRQIVCNAIKDLLRKHNRETVEVDYDENEDDVEEDASETQSDYEVAEDGTTVENLDERTDKDMQID